MLRHDDTSDTSATPAAQVRVTPQELAAALARLEARQGRLDGTIPLGDAVQELGLNATPEELLCEIEAGRTHQHESQPLTQRPFSERLVISVVFALALLLFGSMFAFLRTDGSARPADTIITPSAVPLAAPITIPSTPQAAPITIPTFLLVRQPDHKMALLSEVPDGQPVLCDLAATQNSPPCLSDFGPGDDHWTLIKHGGRVYVRGWIGNISDAALRSIDVAVHPSRSWVTKGMEPIRVTLPLDGFQSPPGETNDTMISASHIVPDAHFKEKW